MSKFYSSDQIVATLRRKGFVFTSQRGSHAKYRKTTNGTIITVILPVDRKEIPHGTFRSILRQSGLVIENFE